MKILASTTFSAKGYEAYGHKVIDTFVKYWPSDIELMVYYDEAPVEGWRNTDLRIIYIPLDAPDLVSFKARNINNPLQKNTVKNDFYSDGIRFSHKVFAYIDSSLLPNVDLSIWLDADIITHATVSTESIVGWLDGKMAASLFRPKMYTETGFHIFDMRHSEARRFMELWRQQYTLDRIWELPRRDKRNKYKGFTDCHTYDVVREGFPDTLWNNLTSKDDRGSHPFVNSILGAHMDHCKGERKKNGHSRASDLTVKRNERYWRKNK